MLIVSKKTKIVATLGPSSSTPIIIRKLIQAGVNVFRLNFSHGSHEDHYSRIAMIQEQGKKLGCYPGILADLQGPKIRTCKTPDDKPITLRKGKKVVLTTRRTTCNDSVIGIDYADLASEIAPGQKVMINDGAVQLVVEKVNKSSGEIECIVVGGGSYSSHKGVNFPNVKLKIPSLTSKDKRDLAFILEQDIQYVALSFVRCADDIQQLRKLIEKRRGDIKIIAKIEKPEAAEAIDEILEVTDGIMVARGDLGVEASPFVVPIIQKTLIQKANSSGKMVIVATQMLESMMHEQIPTRAESTDVANAIIDGTDAVMLSGETAAGVYPVEAVSTMAQIALTTEMSSYYPQKQIDLSNNERLPSHALCEAAAWASRDLGGIPICIFTLSGDSAFYIAKIRSQSPLYAFTPNESVAKKLALAWNIIPIVLSFDNDLERYQERAEAILLKSKLVKQGDFIAIVSGTTPVRGATNYLGIRRIGQK